MTKSCFNCGTSVENTSGLVKVESKEVSDINIRNDGKADHEHETKERKFCLGCLMHKAGVSR